MGHATVLFGDVEPAGQYEPGSAVQSPEQSGDVSASSLPKTPSGQSVNDVADEVGQ